MIKFIVFLILFFFDFISKKIIFNLVELNSFIEIFPIMELTHIHNFGISFGLFSGILDAKFIVFLGIIVTIFLFLMMLKTSNNYEKWALVLILTGAISNIVDRAVNNYVLDFIFLHYKDFYWPAFNLADIYISLGILIIIHKFVKEIIIKKIK